MKWRLMRANLSNANEFACISLHFMLDRVQSLGYETGLLKDKLTFSRHRETCGYDRRNVRWTARVLCKLRSTRPFSLPVDLLVIAVQGYLRLVTCDARGSESPC